MLGYDSEKIKKNSLLRVPSEELLSQQNTKFQDSSRFKLALDNYLNEVILSMKNFDNDLKLKLQMNLDIL